MAAKVGVRSLAVVAPSTVRTNEELRERHPELADRPSRSTLARIMSDEDSEAEMAHFDAAMEPYLGDPFRGVESRRILGADETSIDMEIAAGRDALRLAGREPQDIDLLIGVGFLPYNVGIGNAVHVAQGLGLKSAAWNLESACAGPLNALRAAFALVRAGEHERVLVTVSCSYSKFAREDDTLSWFLGDGGGAFVIEEVEDGGYVAGHSIHTADTCGTWYYTLELDDEGRPARVMRAHHGTGRILRKTVELHLRTCCEGAVSRAGLELSDIDFFVFHTPTAWFSDFAGRALGIPPEKTASIYRHYANVGPALTPINLHYAAYTKRIKPGDRVLVYGPGSVSSATALVMRWGDVAIGEPPDGISYDVGQ